MKENYEQLKMEVITFEKADIITASPVPCEKDCKDDCIM